MKMIRFIIAIFSLTVLLSCSDDFLETKPSNQFSEKDLETAKGMQGSLDGLHNMMYYYDLRQSVLGGRGVAGLNARFDMLGDDMINTVGAYYMNIYRYTDGMNVIDDSGINYKAWDFYYTMIQHANILIKTVNNSTQITDSQRSSFLGEGYAFRAWAYHNLVQLFGKRYVPGTSNDQLGVLIRLEDNPFGNLPRATVGQVYAQIDKDIANALSHLEKAPDKKNKNAIRYSTACGIASRIALSKHDWVSAEKYADLAIQKSGATLQSGMALIDGFRDYNATEWMWGYTQGPDQNLYYQHFNASFSYNMTSSYMNSLRFAVNRDIYDEMGVNDVRRKWWVCLDRGDAIPSDAYAGYFSGGTQNPRWEITGQSIKYKSLSASDSRGDMLVMRLAEMYYTKAEAQARQGKDAEARNTLNTIMKTRDTAYNTTARGTALIDEIMRNKRIDLWMEGHRFFDMKRLGVIPDRLNSKNIQVYLIGAAKTTAIGRNSGATAENVPKTLDSKFWQFAIPYAETKVNDLIIQNEL